MKEWFAVRCICQVRLRASAVGLWAINSKIRTALTELPHLQCLNGVFRLQRFVLLLVPKSPVEAPLPCSYHKGTRAETASIGSHRNCTIRTSAISLDRDMIEVPFAFRYTHIPVCQWWPDMPVEALSVSCLGLPGRINVRLRFPEFWLA